MSKILYVSEQYIEEHWHLNLKFGDCVLVKESELIKIFIGCDYKGFFIWYKSL